MKQLIINNQKKIFLAIIILYIFILFPLVRLGEIYRYFILPIFITTLILITYSNLRTKFFYEKKNINEFIFISLFSLIAFLFSNKDFQLIKNYIYFLLTIYIYISLIRYENYEYSKFISKTLSLLINIAAFFFLVWTFYFYIFECYNGINNHCSIVYVTRQFHYHIIYNTNLFNIFLIFALLQLFINEKKVDKINFFSISVLCLSSVSMMVNIIWFLVILNNILKKKFSEKKLGLSLLLSLIILIFFLFTCNEYIINFLNENLEKIIVKNLINPGEIESISWRLEKLADFKLYIISNFFYDPLKLLFGNEFIQNDNYFHNSFFSIFHFYGIIILVYIIINILRLNNNFQIFIILSYFYTTDNLVMHNFSITFFTWILMAGLVDKNRYKSSIN